MNEIPYGDLVAGPEGKGTPFVAGGRDPTVGLDCRGVSYIAMRRAGMEIPQCPILGAEDIHGKGAQDYLDDYFDDTADGWEVVGAATQLGDLVLSRHAGSPHVSVLVSENPRLVITSHEDRGVLVFPLEVITTVEKVLRWNP